MINAAASDENGTARMGGGIEQLMVGGSKPLFAGRAPAGLHMHNESIGGEAHRSRWNVRSVDIVRWIEHNVRPEEPFHAQLRTWSVRRTLTGLYVSYMGIGLLCAQDGRRGL